MNEIEQSATFAQLWQELSPTQRRFVVAMQEYPTKKEAAEAIGIHSQTAYNWNGPINAAIEFVRNHAALAQLGIIMANGAKASMVVGKLLESEDEAIRLRAAQDVLDRNLGKPTQRQEVQTSGAVTIALQWDDDA